MAHSQKAANSKMAGNAPLPALQISRSPQDAPDRDRKYTSASSKESGFRERNEARHDCSRRTPHESAAETPIGRSDIVEKPLCRHQVTGLETPEAQS